MALSAACVALSALCSLPGTARIRQKWESLASACAVALVLTVGSAAATSVQARVVVGLQTFATDGCYLVGVEGAVAGNLRVGGAVERWRRRESMVGNVEVEGMESGSGADCVTTRMAAPFDLE